MAQASPEYLASLDPNQREHYLRLSRTTPACERKDLSCPKCGSAMVLRLGRYGRFYGCTQFPIKGCEATINALEDGTPEPLKYRKKRKKPSQPAKPAAMTRWLRLLEPSFTVDPE